jgi:hypothetical protein
MPKGETAQIRRAGFRGLLREIAFGSYSQHVLVKIACGMGALSHSLLYQTSFMDMAVGG